MGTILIISLYRVKLWSYPEVKPDPLVLFDKHGNAEITDFDMSKDERFVVSCALDKTTRVFKVEDGTEIVAITWMDRQEQLSMKFCMFFGASSRVLVGAAGARGPAQLGVWGIAKPRSDAQGANANYSTKLIYEAILDKKPMKSGRINDQGDMLCIGFVDGQKKMYRVNQTELYFKKLAEVRAHEMPVMAVGFFKDDRADEHPSIVSASGDYSVHFGPFRIAESKGCCGGSCCCFLLMLLSFLVFAGLVLFMAVEDLEFLTLRPEDVENWVRNLGNGSVSRGLDL